MKNAAPWITAGFLLGLAAICAGVVLIYAPAGLIVGGALTCYAAMRLDETEATGPDAQR